VITNKYNKEIFITKLFLTGSVIFSGLFYFQLIRTVVSGFNTISRLELAVVVMYILISVFIIYGNLIYHLTRLGLYLRLRTHIIPSESDLEKFFCQVNPPLVTFLVPAYKEEVRVIEQTLWSAALQNYPKKRIVLLIDNPPNPIGKIDTDLLSDTRQMTADLNQTFRFIRQEVNAGFTEFENNAAKQEFDSGYETEKLNDIYTRVTAWFSANMVDYEERSHVDTFYIKNIYGKWLGKLTQEAGKLSGSGSDMNGQIDFMRSKYQIISGILNVDISCFERKMYKNLSHEPNKAMNINSYLGLMGKAVRIFSLGKDKYIEVTKDPNIKTIIPDSKYVITLDADSMLLQDYVIKLVNEMEKPENSKIAVIQTPYSAFPGAKSAVELVAGATTDIQYNVHQGFTYYNSTYWVGANAMLRRAALEDIRMLEIQGDKVSVKYVQDRTVIEDTESSIDLVEKGWKLLNYPERLAYSSTPPDFGSLIIQRERWANGGLIIFPKLLRYVLRKPFELKRWVEFFVRGNYLTSIAGINIGTLLVLIYPFKDDVFTLWLPLASIPYYYLYTRDLKLMGYELKSIFRVYALNMILIPINIAGVLKSVKQGITGSKIPFKRTPKIGNRVVAEAKFILFQYGLLIYTFWAAAWDIYNSHLSHVLYASINGLILLYGIKTFIGFKNSWSDIRSQLANVDTGV